MERARKPDEMPADPARQLDRTSTLIAGRIVMGRAERPVRVRNLSAGGAMVEMASPPPAGSRVILVSAKTGAVGARVVWVRGERLGLRFNAPVAISLEPRRTCRPPPAASFKRPAMRPLSPASGDRGGKT